MRKKINPVNKMFREFDEQRGKCSLEAIAFMFKLDLHAVQRTLRTTGWKSGHEGTSFQQCNSAISLLADIHLKNVKYVSNKTKMKVPMFLRMFNKGEFLLNQEGHVSAVKNGVAYDNYSPENYALLGWWAITKKYEIELCRPARYKFNRRSLDIPLSRPTVKIWKK